MARSRSRSSGGKKAGGGRQAKSKKKAAPVAEVEVVEESGGMGIDDGIPIITAVILIVVYGWKWMARVRALRKDDTGKVRGGSSSESKAAPAIEAEDMGPCAVCGAFVPAERPTTCPGGLPLSGIGDVYVARS